MTFDARTVDLAVLNSMTKYPSIPTYHALDTSNGNLSEPTVEFSGQVIGTEKVDGTNARIIFLPDEGPYILGSREELLYAQGDLISNASQGIVGALKDLAELVVTRRGGALGYLEVFYLEVYGGTVGKSAKQYTGNRRVGYRLFDVVETGNWQELLSMPVERIAAWRDAGGQNFLGEADLASLAEYEYIPRVPRLFTVDAARLPTGVEETAAWLREELPKTQVALDQEANGVGEGIVLRTADRSVIAKARIEDYDRTIRRRAGTQKVKARA